MLLSTSSPTAAWKWKSYVKRLLTLRAMQACPHYSGCQLKQAPLPRRKAMSESEFISHTDIKERLEAEGFEVTGEDTGGGCWVAYANKEGGTRVTLGPFMWEEGMGLACYPGDFTIGPDEMNPETGDSVEPYPDMANLPSGATLDDLVAIVLSEYGKLNA
jgi:hypothetical protein